MKLLILLTGALALTRAAVIETEAKYFPEKSTDGPGREELGNSLLQDFSKIEPAISGKFKRPLANVEPSAEVVATEMADGPKPEPPTMQQHKMCRHKHRPKRFANLFKIFGSVFNKDYDRPSIPYISNPSYYDDGSSYFSSYSPAGIFEAEQGYTQRFRRPQYFNDVDAVDVSSQYFNDADSHKASESFDDTVSYEKDEAPRGVDY